MSLASLFEEYGGLLQSKSEIRQDIDDLNSESHEISEEEYNSRSKDIESSTLFAYEKGVISETTAREFINSVSGDTSKVFDVTPERECNIWDEEDDTNEDLD